MSGGIRRSIAPTIARTKKYLEEFKDFCLGQPSATEDAEQFYSQKTGFLKKRISQMRNAVQYLESKNEEWLQLLRDPANPKADKDEEAYETMSRDEESGLIWILDRAKEAVTSLEISLEDAMKSWEKAISFQQPQSTPLIERSRTPISSHPELERAPSPAEQSEAYNYSEPHQFQSPVRHIVPRMEVKLPKLSLKEFDGEPKKWREFSAHFQSAVGEQNIPTIQKLNYLLSCLKGAAARAVEGYEICEENYNIIWNLLKRRFGDSAVLKRGLYCELQNLKSNEKDFRGLVENIERILRQLESLNESIEQPYLEMLIEQHLPQWVLIGLYVEKERDQPWNMTKLRAYLETTAKRKEDVDRIRESRQPYQKVLKNPVQSKAKEWVPNSTSAFAVTEKKDKRSPNKPCAFCDNHHWNDDCKKYRTYEERIEQVRRRQLCFKCLKDGHSSKSCQKKPQCFHCKKPHNSALCSRRHQGKPAMTSESTTRQEAKVSNAEAVIASTVSQTTSANDRRTDQSQNTVLLLCKTVWIANPQQPEKKIKATVFFDSGCQRSFITEELVSKLALTSKVQKPISIAAFAEKQPKVYESREVEVELVLKNGLPYTITANTMQFLTQKLMTISLDSKQAQHLRTTDPEIIEVPTIWQKPQIIIGLDHYFTFIKGRRTVLKSGFQLIDTAVGWMIAGKGAMNSPNVTTKKTQAQTAIITSAVIQQQLDVNQIWQLDMIGITDPIQTTDEDEAVAQFERSITRGEDGRYFVSWPWKKQIPSLQTNYSMCLARLKSTVRKLRQNPDLLEQYDQTFKKQLEEGIIEKVEEDQFHGYTTYLPHQAVLTPLKATTKLRVVFDASAKTSQGKSLNDELLKGPCSLPDLCGILLRFRQACVVILADVEKAFLQVGLHQHDRDCTRFIWLKDKNGPVVNNNLQTYRFTRVPFGVISSPFLLASTLRKHLKEENSETSREILRNLYVDNVMITASTSTEAIQKYTETKLLFQNAKMNIREFISNDPQFNSSIPPTDISENTEVAKVLGIPWLPKEDKIVMQLHTPSETLNTKRKILHFIASIFDPLGWIVPILVPLKCFLQDLWKEGYLWDQELREAEQKRWEELMNSWNATQFVVPRQVQRPSSELQLHIFVDASAKAYAAVAYLRESSSDGVQAHLIFAKARLCPVKGASIPRLELLAALIGIRLLSFIQKELNINNVPSYIWSDSKCVLHWIRSPRENKSKFVENRLKEIRMTRTRWNYVPTNENAADIASKGSSPQQLENHKLWWTGPSWLVDPTEKWPKWEKSDMEEYPEEAAEAERKETAVKKKQPVPVNDPSIVSSVADVQNQDVQWMDSTRFSKWVVMRASLAKAIRFARNLRQKERNRVDWRDYQEAEKLLFQQVQTGGISEQEKLKWDLFKDKDQVWRCSGRVLQTQLPRDTRFPIYLPRSSRITELIIIHYHETHFHSGVAHTLTQLRQRFWIPQGRAVVKKIINRCAGCQRWRSKPFQLPRFPAHPANRVNPSRPFQYIGLDYFEPITISTDSGPSKRWICLYTCLTTRAVHLEIAHDLSAEAFINCLRKFIARRGVPESIMCDNATQYKLAAKTIELGLNQLEQGVADYCSSHAIKWKFITEFAPWQGGLYERLVGITKQSLRQAIGKRFLKEEHLSTMLTEIESIINCRPLTYLNEENNDVLRPIDFLIPKANLSIPIINEETEEEYKPIVMPREKLLQQWKKSLKYLDRFWKFWQANYLSMLRERVEKHHRKPRSTVKREPRISEIVLIMEENLPRGRWKLGRITEVGKGKDGQIRTATIQTANGRKWTRPINLILPLEIAPNMEEKYEPVADPNIEEEEEETVEPTIASQSKSNWPVLGNVEVITSTSS